MPNSFILLTGMPGCGKTTIIKRIVDELKKNGNNNIKGFYTRECRNSSGERTGFDIFTLDGSSTALARISSPTSKSSSYKVGKYNVYVSDFEGMCMKYLESHDGSLLVIDEIGKMELFSKKFETAVKNFLKIDNNLKILATVPLKANINLIDQLKNHKNARLYHITKSNRDEIYAEIYEALQKMISS
ncbi:nucleoside-triphosphatase THEP1 [Chironomus tepperi]|uniref:nucleoside-triphosphatase THEP1 n=1 Tax=Chironomus tepperi TaxID=113505 RepID=UPI00391F1425